MSIKQKIGMGIIWSLPAVGFCLGLAIMYQEAPEEAILSLWIVGLSVGFTAMLMWLVGE